jgi:hypothetical protein
MGRAAASGLLGILAGDADEATVRTWIADLNAMILKETKQPSLGPVDLS